MYKIFGLGLIAAVAPLAIAAAPSHHATAKLVTPDGTEIGTAKLTETGTGVDIALEAAHLPPGTHAIHVHMIGRCEAPDFASAGAHWNPGGKHHGLDSPQGAHMGDLPNFVVDPAGKAKFKAQLTGAHLAGAVPSILDEDGGALVIHAQPDDNHSDPSGNSGARIACGVITAAP